MPWVDQPTGSRQKVRLIAETGGRPRYHIEFQTGDIEIRFLEEPGDEGMDVVFQDLPDEAIWHLFLHAPVPMLAPPVHLKGVFNPESSTSGLEALIENSGGSKSFLGGYYPDTTSWVGWASEDWDEDAYRAVFQEAHRVLTLPETNFRIALAELSGVITDAIVAAIHRWRKGMGL